MMKTSNAATVARMEEMTPSHLVVLTLDTSSVL